MVFCEANSLYQQVIHSLCGELFSPDKFNYHYSFPMLFSRGSRSKGDQGDCFNVVERQGNFPVCEVLAPS